MGPPVARALFVAAVLCAPAGCRAAGSARLQGKWHGLRAEGVAAAAQRAANAFATATEIDVDGDDISVATPKEKQQGRYKVVEEDKTTLVITTDKDGPDDKQTFTFPDAKTLEWHVVDGQLIVFGKRP